jgi:hypothetical protein
MVLPTESTPGSAWQVARTDTGCNGPTRALSTTGPGSDPPGDEPFTVDPEFADEPPSSVEDDRTTT